MTSQENDKSEKKGANSNEPTPVYVFMSLFICYTISTKTLCISGFCIEIVDTDIYSCQIGDKEAYTKCKY